MSMRLMLADIRSGANGAAPLTNTSVVVLQAGRLHGSHRSHTHCHCHGT
jgi:hypothetical protein